MPNGGVTNELFFLNVLFKDSSAACMVGEKKVYRWKEMTRKWSCWNSGGKMGNKSTPFPWLWMTDRIWDVWDSFPCPCSTRFTWKQMFVLWVAEHGFPMMPRVIWSTALTCVASSPSPRRRSPRRSRRQTPSFHSLRCSRISPGISRLRA